MSNLRMVPDNYIDTSIVNASPSLVVGLDEENLKNISRARVTRTTSNVFQTISGTFNSLKDVSAIVLGRHNLPVNTIYTIRLFLDTLSTIEVYNTGDLIVQSDEIGSDLWAWGDFIWGATAWGADKQIEEFSPKANLVHWLDTPVQAQSFSITIQLPAGTASIIPLNGGLMPLEQQPAESVSHFEIGRLIIGKYIEPKYNISFGHGMTWIESTKQYRTDAGTLRSDIGLPNRQIEFSINTMEEADRSLIQNALRKVGLRKDFFISLFPNDVDRQKEIDYSGIVKLVKTPKYTEFAPKYYKSKYIVQEV